MLQLVMSMGKSFVVQREEKNEIMTVRF